MADDAFRDDPNRACAPLGRTPNELFTSDDHSDQELAKEICRQECPFRQKCFDYALEIGERWHVWGGVLMSSNFERRNAINGIKATAEHVREMWGMRFSDGQIGEVLGLNATTISDYRHRLGLPALYGSRGKPLEVAA